MGDILSVLFLMPAIGLIFYFLFDDMADDLTNRFKFMIGLKMWKVYRP